MTFSVLCFGIIGCYINPGPWKCAWIDSKKNGLSQTLTKQINATWYFKKSTALNQNKFNVFQQILPALTSYSSTKAVHWWHPSSYFSEKYHTNCIHFICFTKKDVIYYKWLTLTSPFLISSDLMSWFSDFLKVLCSWSCSKRSLWMFNSCKMWNNQIGIKHNS